MPLEVRLELAEPGRELRKRDSQRLHRVESSPGSTRRRGTRSAGRRGQDAGRDGRYAPGGLISSTALGWSWDTTGASPDSLPSVSVTLVRSMRLGRSFASMGK